MRIIATGVIAAALLVSACAGPASTEAAPTSHTEGTTHTTITTPSASLGALLLAQGYTADEIDTIVFYQQAACATLEDNPQLRVNWNEKTIREELKESFDIDLRGDTVRAIKQTC